MQWCSESCLFEGDNVSSMVFVQLSIIGLVSSRGHDISFFVVMWQMAIYGKTGKRHAQHRS